MINVSGPETVVEKIRAVGGGGFRDVELDLFHELEVNERALAADTTISESHRRDKLAQLRERIDASLSAAEEAEIAAARKPIETARGRLLAEIKGTTVTRSDSIETTDAQRERLGRRTVEALRLNVDVTAAAACSDPEWLRDMLEEALLSEQPERTRVLGQVVISRLRTLVSSEVPGAREALTAAIGQYDAWQTKNPSRMARFRAVEEELASFERPIRRRFDKARESFRFGAHAHGIRM